MRLHKVQPILSCGDVPSVANASFYVFERHIVFCWQKKIYAVSQWRDGIYNAVDSFCALYPALFYKSLLDLDVDDLHMIRSALKELM